MANHASHAALPYPIKGARFSVQVPYLDADGDPTDPTTPDTEISKDGGAYADCSEEVSTITGSNGSGWLTLTGDELNVSMFMVAAKVASGPKATLMTGHPRVLAKLENGTAQAGAAGSITLASGAAAFDISGCFVKTTGGTGGGGGSGSLNNQVRRITTYNVSTKVATIEPNWETNPDSTTTYDILLPEGMSIGGLKALQPTTAGRTLDVSTDGDAEANVTKYGGTAGTFASGRPEVNTSHVAGTAQTAGDIIADTNDIQARLPAALVSGRMDASVGAMATDVVTAAALAADAGAEIADAVWDENIVAAHGTADTAGRCIRTLDAISDRGNNSNLNALLGVADTSGADVPSQVTDEVWDEDLLFSHTGGGMAGKALGNLGNAIASRTNNNNLNALLGVPDVAGTDVPSQVTDEVWDEARAGHVVAGSFGQGAASVQGNVTGSVGSVTGAVGSVTGDIGSLGATAKADVNAEVVDVLTVDTHAELGAVPGIAATLRDMIRWLFTLARNKRTTTATMEALRDDADTVNLATAGVSDDGTTATRNEWA